MKVCGINSDVCVLKTVLDLPSLFKSVKKFSVLSNSCGTSSSAEDHIRALNKMSLQDRVAIKGDSEIGMSSILGRILLNYANILKAEEFSQLDIRDHDPFLELLDLLDLDNKNISMQARFNELFQSANPDSAMKFGF